MKKVICILTVIIMMMSISAIAEETEEKYNDYRDNVWFETIIDDFNRAYENGEEVSRCHGYLYEGIIYMADVHLNATGAGYTGTIDRDHIKEIERYLENILKDEGAKFPEVEIRFAGQDENGEDIYEFCIMMMENLNEYNGEKSGNGFIKEGFEYYGIKGLGTIT